MAASEKRGKLLIVDDEPSITNLLSDLFDHQGYQVSVASDGDKALKLFEREQPDLVLLDLHMPKVDGLSVLRGMKELDPKTRIIILTADGDEALAKALMREGACDFLQKPFDIDYLEESVAANMLLRL